MSRRTTTIVRRRATAWAAGLVVLSGLTLVAAPAHADSLGKMFIDPSTGNQDTFMTFDTNAPCPDGTQAVKAFLTGPGITNDGNNNLTGNTDYAILQTNAAGGKEIAAQATLKTVFQQYGLPQSANYDITVRCMSRDGATTYGDFVTQIAVVWSGSGFGLTYTQASQATATTTVLSALPADPVAAGTTTELTATVTPSDASGSVQFKRDGINFGGAVPVVDGVATFSAALPQGNPQVTATFVPSDANAFSTSTSDPVSYLVVPKPVLTGTPQVGMKLTCSIDTAAGTNAFAWLVDGTADQSQTKSSATVPSSWSGKKVACQVTTTRSGRSVTQSSSQVTIKAAVIKNTKLPTVSGTYKVGKSLTCKPGSWTPSGLTYAYQWLRDGKAISKATKSTYKLVKADQKQKVACKVTASTAGAKSVSAVSKAKAVA